MKVIANELSIINVRLSNDDLLLYILNGIGPKFKEKLLTSVHLTPQSLTKISMINWSHMKLVLNEMIPLLQPL